MKNEKFSDEDEAYLQRYEDRAYGYYLRFFEPNTAKHLAYCDTADEWKRLTNERIKARRTRIVDSENSSGGRLPFTRRSEKL